MMIVLHATPEWKDTNKLDEAITYFSGGETIFIDISGAIGDEEVTNTLKDNAFLCNNLSSMAEVHTSSTKGDSSNMPRWSHCFS